MMFCVVLEPAARPITQRQPSQKIDDMGARLCEPSSLTLPIKTTGVPKYKDGGAA